MFRSITNNASKNLSAGGTISGDVTIAGDLTVQGSTANTYDEQIQGLHHVKVDDTTLFQSIIEQDGTGDAALKFDLTGARSWLVGLDNSDDDKFKISMDANDLNDANAITIDTSLNIGIGETSPTEIVEIAKDSDGAATTLVINNSNTGTSTDETAEIQFQHKSIKAAKIVAYRRDDYSSSAQYTSGLKFISTNSNVEFVGITQDQIGRVGIGTTSPDSLVELEALAGDTQLTITTYSDTITHSPKLLFRHSNQDTVGVTETVANEAIGAVYFQGVNSADSPDAFHTSASIEGWTDDAPDGDAQAGRLLFSTSDSSSSGNQERMRITSAGNIGIGVVPDDQWDTLLLSKLEKMEQYLLM